MGEGIWRQVLSSMQDDKEDWKKVAKEFTRSLERTDAEYFDL
jgi:hypothetical protein